MKKNKTVLVSRGFDPLHTGHIRMFQEAKELGIEAEFNGNGVKEYAKVNFADSKIAPAVILGQRIFDQSDRYYRPAEVDKLLGDPTLANKELDWEPKNT